MVPFQRLPSGQVTVEGRVGDGPPVPFILDTGASMTVLSRGVWDAARLGPPDGRRLAITAAGGSSGGTLAHGVPFALGGVSYTSRVVVVLDDDGLSAVVGRDLFDRWVVDLDFDARFLRLLPHGTPAPASAFVGLQKTRGGLFRTAATVGETRVHAVIDLGASVSIVNGLGGDGLAAVAGRSGSAFGADGRPVALTGVVAPLRVGPVRLAAHPLYRADLSVFGALGLAREPAMILGLDVLARDRLVLDLAGRRAWLGVTGPM